MRTTEDRFHLLTTAETALSLGVFFIANRILPWINGCLVSTWELWP